jgi:dCTP deaminase
MDEGSPHIDSDISLRVEEDGDDYDPAQFAGDGIYSDRQVKEALQQGHIRIYPFEEANLSGTSYDVRLGEYFFTTDRLQNKPVYNPYDPDDVARYFEYQAKRAEPHQEICQKRGLEPFANIPPEHPVILLQPHERILAHTYEFIGINPPGTTQMLARSTTGRNGIVVCKDAGWGDPGYKGRWTMEIQNDNHEMTPLPVGVRIAQIVFLRSGQTQADYGQQGKYYQSSTLADEVQKWTPDMMLPRAYKDEIRPLPPLMAPEEGDRD